MLYYHFTNDLRFKNIKENLYAVANHLVTGVWSHPYQTLEQAKKGWYPVFCFYFGLAKDTHNADLILTGKWNYVLGEFIKKFQFPNPKSDNQNYLKKEVDNNQHIAPLRTLVKLLFFSYEFGENEGISKDDFKKYVLGNVEVAINNISIGELYNNIKNKVPVVGSYEENVDVSGGDVNRFANQILGAMEPLEYVVIESNVIKLSFDNISNEDKAILFDIITYDGFWELNSRNESQIQDSYRQYIQSPENVEIDYESGNTVVDESLRLLSDSFRQCIYFGAPGTGKSYQLSKDSEKFIRSNIERVTFHPNMTYGQFVGVFKPFPINDGKITYRYIPGPLMKQLVQALLHPEFAYLVIIEELNRANVAATFGDMFQLLDRTANYESEYPINISEDLDYYFTNVVYKNEEDERVEIMNKKIINGLIFPKNFFIWTTMNSADQGVMPMDTAFKRRWEQKYFGINQVYEDNQDEFDGYKKIIVKLNGNQKALIAWNDIREFINERLTTMKVPEDKLMGPYFISKSILESSNKKLTESFKTKVLMYLFDDAVKQNRNVFFDVAPEKMMYSEILKKFEEYGLSIFKGYEKLEEKAILEE